MAKKMNDIWTSVIEEFEWIFPRDAERVVDWYPSGRYEITIKFDDGSKIIYNSMTQQKRPANLFSEANEDIEEEEWRKRYGKNLLLKLQLRDMTQEELSEMTGISRITINRYIKGKATPSTYNNHKLANALRCSPGELGDIF